MTKFVIVVSRYNEDISWTKQFEENTVIIYNKGSAITHPNIELNNVGREGHTYYHYIYENYDNLPEYMAFLQGNPFDHSPNVIKNLEKLSDSKDVDFSFLSEKILDCNLSGCSYHSGIPLISVYEYLFDEKKTTLYFKFGQGAQFIVSRERIKKRPREFYLKIVRLLEKEVNPIEGFVIERFHSLIFS